MPFKVRTITSSLFSLHFRFYSCFFKVRKEPLQLRFPMDKLSVLYLRKFLQ